MKHRLAISLALYAPDTQPPLEGWLEGMLARVAGEAGVAEGELNVAVVGDAEMAGLHARYKGDATTTDVLTFDLRLPGEDGGPETGRVEGDIVICVDEAARQAGLRGHDARVEALLYAVHGLMHLLGEDDGDEAAAARMHEREDRLLTAIGLGSVFHRSVVGGDEH